MKKSLVIIAVAASLAAIPQADVLAKGHVPDNKDQVCHRGRVLTVGSSAVEGHMRHGDDFVDKNDPDNIVFTGDPCP